uniref:Hypoxanthine phosphoribosyltransferase n=1 Tax=Noctiluca scintillans TaxID=2966 RepID=A0A7S1ANH7_NOCSC
MAEVNHPDIETCLFSPDDISARIKELGAQITAENVPDDKPLLVVGVLTGCFVFMGDLVREIALPTEMDFVQCSSYGASAVSSGQVIMKKDLCTDPAGRNIIVVEDIIDTGLTLETFCENLVARGAKSVKVCALLDKSSRRKATRVGKFCQYIGFDCPDEFVVGYGIDYAEKYRNLPWVGALKKSIYQKVA